MPIKLNPCEMCGANPRRIKMRETERPTFTVYCPVCDNEIEDAKYTQEKADAAWNSANPKEGKLDDTQTV